MTRVLVRLATDSDSKSIFEWRNDKITRRMSHTSEIIEWEEHSNWYANSLASENCVFLICEGVFSEQIAVVRFDISELETVVSINLNPSQRNKGLAKESLLKSIDFFSKRFTKMKRLVAEIKEENIASKKIFLSMGFEKYEIDGDVGFYEKILM